MAYEIPIVSRNRCCNSNCEAGNPEAPTCWEVYLPGTNPEDDLPYRWYIDANVYDTIDGRMYDAIGRQHLYQSDHADCEPCSEGTDPVENIVGLRAIRFLKIGECGPIRVSWMFGNGIGQGCGGDDDADYYTFTDRTDSRLVLPGEFGDIILIPCQTPYLLAEAAPTCLRVTGDIQLNQIVVQNGGPCGDTDEPHNDLFGALSDASGTKILYWAIDGNQVNITLTYTAPGGPYTLTFPFEREWWLTTRNLVNASSVFKNLTDCSQVICETTNDCWPCPCIADGETGDPVVAIFCDVETPIWTDTVTLLWNGTSYQYAEAVFPFKAVTIQCMGGDPITYMVTVIDGPNTYIFAINGALTCDESGLEMEDVTATDGTASVTLFTNNQGLR